MDKHHSVSCRPGPGLCLVLAAAAVLLGACGSVSSDPSARPADVATFVPQTATQLLVGDDIEVKFDRTPELNERQFIRSDGSIALPLQPAPVQAAGLTPQELEGKLMALYGERLVRPVIAVLVRGSSANKVYLYGEVNQQGAQPLAPDMTVSRAVIAAQGLKTTAHESQTLVIRRQPDGGRQVRTVDLAQVFEGDQARQDIVLQPADIVYVPRTAIASANIFVDQYIRQMLPTTSGVPLLP